jgi:hypothetical protein
LIIKSLHALSSGAPARRLVTIFLQAQAVGVAIHHKYTHGPDPVVTGE